MTNYIVRITLAYKQRTNLQRKGNAKNGQKNRKHPATAGSGRTN
jgi:hypothetical protein